MKRLLFFISLGFLLYIIYFDLTNGTLPAATGIAENPNTSVPASRQASESTIPFKVQEIKPGDTLLSLIEKQNGSAAPEIEQMIDDFQSLNEGTKPEDIQIGKRYKIPVYK
ncbi:LysM peptidoglycan-binding domain-containing protein [Bacillus massiliglaciei]|uniref:LysM peptidoglycan-binding domain-containing protein n=1 Tax=Bacillus massiliglaciei TaxID=1816693 RepID=UPI000DA616D2|nr:LysM domain-containing protein [Bacillus massiliglaciei]